MERDQEFVQVILWIGGCDMVLMGDGSRVSVSSVLVGGGRFLRLFARNVEGGAEVVDTEHLAELHLAGSGLAILISGHRDSGQGRAIEADELVEVDLELRLHLPAFDTDCLVAHD